jgi:predicted nucleic acid-binding protein
VKVLLDINVVLDVLQQRPGFFRPAADLFAAVEAGRISASIAGHTVTTAYYIMRRSNGSELAGAALLDLLRVVDVVPVVREDLLRALRLEWRDFEDAVQAVCAEKTGAEVVVTRNLDDFRASTVPAVSPVDALAMLDL